MKKIIYRCDNCLNELDIEYPDRDDEEFDDAGWTHDRHTTNTHYCDECTKQNE